MRLLTKDWYQTMQGTGMGVLLRPDERAAEFSEELFQELWEEKISEWIEMRRGLCPILEQEFDEAHEMRVYEENHAREVERFRTRLPEGIRKKVADLRVLALGHCTGEVFEDLKEYREWCRKCTEKTMEEAWNMRCSQGLDQYWTGEHSLHDAFVLGMKWEGEDLLLEFEHEPGASWPEIKGARFHDARILKQEQSPERGWWLYDEIWRTEEGGYEIHALLWRDLDVFELTIGCREAEILWTMEPKKE